MCECGLPDSTEFRNRQFVRQLEIAPIHSFSLSLQKEVFSLTDQKRIIDAMAFLSTVTAGQKPRENGLPEVTHPMGVAKHVIEISEHPNPDTVIAALFHDIIEDRSVKILELSCQNMSGNIEEKALQYVGSVYGSKIKELLIKLTNPDYEKELAAIGISKTDARYFPSKNILYKTHVEQVIQDPNVAIIKFCDFAANAFTLSELPIEKQIPRMQKYLPVMQVFLDRFIHGSDIPVKPRERQKIIHDLYVEQEEMRQQLNQFVLQAA